jgi:UDP-N-acetylmuramoyl-tripeptide--D-alanyl-D-alanine ligase
MFSAKDLILATDGSFCPGRFSRRFGGISIDTRTIKPDEAYVAIVGKNFDGHDFIPEAIKRGAKAIVYADKEKVEKFEKGIAYIKVVETTKALGAIARYHRKRFDIPVIAITGSSGKTTTKEMIAWVLSAKYNVLKNQGTQNNLIGVPLTLLAIHSKHDICVVEMGTNREGEIKQLAEIALPNIAVVTNIGPAHLEFLGTLKGVYKEKIELVRHLTAPQVAFLNKGDIILGKLSRIRSKPYFFFGINAECDLKAADIFYKPDGVSFLFNGIHPFAIRHCALHNVSNALPAIGCGLLFGLDINIIREKVGTFDSPDMRLKEIRMKDCVVFDDSYNSNPQSLKQAIDVLCRQAAGSRRILVMGDMLELGKKSEEFHAYFGRYVSKKPVDILVTMGAFSSATSESARKCGMSAACIFHFEDCAGVMGFLKENVKEGDVLLVKGSRSMQMEKIVAFLKERG